ncbi:NAD(P)-dependent oxidoreductase [Modestobacter sp. Leaf380]|uniref:NAD(P)-dependent oxidoreductase n=1 Tax=Modestobacter sp. Leaf380 TaxID=1736356 RepID=UPI0006FFC873|nr:NAD(P)-dependent oxidoreductase [Modestobacter sp. Leaf380]KQS72141.1 hypothetical protein ASG41_18965 [Modestobacter sp. Leaf380]
MSDLPSRGRVLVTPRSMTAAGVATLPALRPLTEAGYELVSGPPGRQPTAADLHEVADGVVGWVAGVERIDDEVLAAFPDLRAISRNGAGADAIDAAAAERRGVQVATARGANARGVAELAFAHVLAGLRGLPLADRVLREGGWARTPGRELPDLTVGVVGFGAIGRTLAGFAAAFGARVLVSDPFARVPEGPGAPRQVALDELFAGSDVISLHAPPPADGTALVGVAQLATVPTGAVLVNTARSSLVDDAAVLAALESGRLSAYAVDAFESEPPALTPLLRHERTILSPHLGGYTDASVRRATEQSVVNLLVMLDSGPPE